MTMLPGTALETLPAVVFQFSENRLEFLNGESPLFPGLTTAKLGKILRGGWREIVPREFHPVVWKLGLLLESRGHTTVEFPVYWMGNPVWLRIFAAATSQGKAQIIGLAQNVTLQRQSSPDADAPHEPVEEEADPLRKLRHAISGSLTSIIMNCEFLLDDGYAAEPRRRIEAILAEALRIDQILQQYHG